MPEIIPLGEGRRYHDNEPLAEGRLRPERAAAEAIIVRHPLGARRLTLEADKGYDPSAFVTDLRMPNVTPHIVQNLSGRCSAINWPASRLRR
jgi:hypothetical protein